MLFYVGTYTGMGGPGLCVCSLDHGRLRLLDAARELDDPIYAILSQDDRTLFAVGSDPATGEGVAASYAVSGSRLTLLSAQPTGGRAACHLTLDPQERALYAANYLSGSVSVFPVRGDRLLPRTQLIEHEGHSVHPLRQEKAHTHQCVFRPGTRELFVCDLGLDRVVIYDSEPADGRLTPRGAIDTPPGMGPRHLIFDTPDSFYLVGELDNHILRYVRSGEGYAPTHRACTVPEGAQSALGAVRLRGGHVYASNRGFDTICELSASLDVLRQIPSGGSFPRDFDFTPDGELLIANQNGGGVVCEGGDALPIAGAVSICLPHTL